MIMLRFLGTTIREILKETLKTLTGLAPEIP